MGPGGMCQTFVGKNNFGTNVKTSADSTSSADQCCSICAQTSGCVGYTWVHDNRECWLKSAVEAPRDDECGGCVTSGTYSAPTPAPTPGCPGGSLAACITSCPSDPAVFQVCVDECTKRCSSSCTGGDDGDNLKTCMEGCPSEKYAD